MTSGSVGTGGKAVAEQVVPVLRPKTYIPGHRDGLFNAFWPGMPHPFKDVDLGDQLAEQKIALMPQTQYFERYIVSSGAVTMDLNQAVKARLGAADAQRFGLAMLEAVVLVDSTRVGDECGERFTAPAPCASLFAAWHQAQSR